MLSIEKSIRALVQAREQLVKQIDAVDRAIAILRGETRQPAEGRAAEHASVPAVNRVRPKRVLSEEHKRAMVEGRRKSKLAKEIAAGRAFEPVDVPAIAAPASEVPRLVKRREFTLEPDPESVAH
jgi:hypothetical protein